MTDPGKRPEDEHDDLTPLGGGEAGMDEELDRVTAEPTGQAHPEEDQSD
jgi:hypothetical protein